MADPADLVLPSVRERLDAFCANPGAMRLGRRLVQDGLYQFRGFKPAKVDLFADWTVNPFGHRSWQWQTASFNFMPWLLAFHAAEGDRCALEHGFAAVDSWRDKYFQGKSDYEFAWHDHATSSRALNVFWFLSYLRIHGLESERQPGLEQFLAVLGEKLAGKDIYSRHTNHGIDQCRVLALLAVSLPSVPEAKGWLKIAVERLGDELAFAFRNDGCHVENSPAYHQFVAGLFGEIARTFSPGQLGPLEGRLRDMLPRAAEFMAWIVRPDGQLPPIGDTEQRTGINVFRTLAGSQVHAELEWVISRGQRGRQPSGWARTFAQGGYFIAREDWSAGRTPGEAFHLVLRCGAHSRYHRHDDDLSLVLSWGGEWLLDGGMHNYVEAAPVRRYLRSKWAHNLPLPLGFGPDWSRPASEAPGSLQCLKLDDEQAEVQANTASYPGFKASRRLQVDLPGRRFTVHDVLVPESDGEAGHPGFLSLWHVPADRQVELDGRRARIIDPATRRELRIEALDDTCEAVSLLEPGIDEEHTGAVWSRDVNRLLPAQVLAFRYAGTSLDSRLRFTMIDPSPAIGPAPGSHGRRLFASYCATPEAWWPEAGQRQARKITLALAQMAERDQSAPEQVVDDCFAAATLRQRSRRRSVYLANAGSSGAHWLESLLVAAGGMLAAGEVHLPESIRQRLLELAPRDHACFVDALHLLHARALPSRSLVANTINSAHSLKPEAFLRSEPGAMRVLLLRDPYDVCRERGQGAPDPAHADAAIRRVRLFLAWAARQNFDLVVRYEDLLADPRPAVRAICGKAGAPVHEDRLERAIKRLAATAPAAKGSAGPAPDALESRIHDALGELAEKFGYARGKDQ
ncbi:heparinase II/III domain-containing protein [Arenimonas aestuarii]